MFVTKPRIIPAVLLMFCLGGPAAGALAPVDAVESQSFILKCIKAEEAARILKDLIGDGKSKKFTVAVEPATNKLIVCGCESDLERVQLIIGRIDTATRVRGLGGPPRFANIELKNWDARQVTPTLKVMFGESSQFRMTAIDEKIILLYATPEDLFDVSGYLQALDNVPQAQRRK